MTAPCPSSNGLSHDSIADIPEDQLVERLLSDLCWRIDLFGGMPGGTEDRQRVLLDTAPGNVKGEIDAILCDPDEPEHAVAYEVKRVKFSIDQLSKGTPSKLDEFGKLVQQANRCAKMGFWQVYAYVVVVVDARDQNAGKNPFAGGLSPDLKGTVFSRIKIDSFDERVGAAVLVFTQTMGEAFANGTHEFYFRRPSTPTTQSKELTQWVAGLFSKQQ